MWAKMRVQLALVILFVLVAVLAVPSFVLAGGWVVITLDQMPEELTAGQPYPLGMMARQHGQTPFMVDSLRIVAKQVATGDTVTLTAEPDGQPGHYQVDLLLPASGRWEWGIESGLYPDRQPLPVLDVADPSQVAGIAANRAREDSIGVPGASALITGFFVLLAFLAGGVLLVKGRNKWFPMLAGAGLIILSGGLTCNILLFPNVPVEQLRPVPVTAAGESVGQQLFLAKGCVICHTNDRAIVESEQYGVNAGPNLTHYRNDPAYLHQFLKDPQSVRADAKMPDLGLKLEEIEALIAFINEPE